MGLGGSLDFSGRRYIEEALKNMAFAETALRDECENMSADVKSLSEKSQKNAENYFDFVKRLYAYVKKYNDTLVSESFWGNIDEAEKKKRLGTYNAFISGLDGFYIEQAYFLPNESGASEALLRAYELEKKVLLFGVGLSYLGKTAEIEELRCTSNYLKNEICNISESIKALSGALLENERLLRSYISALSLAADEKGRGSEMNLRSMRECTLAFIASLKMKI